MTPDQINQEAERLGHNVTRGSNRPVYSMNEMRAGIQQLCPDCNPWRPV